MTCVLVGGKQNNTSKIFFASCLLLSPNRSRSVVLTAGVDNKKANRQGAALYQANQQI